MSEDDNKVVKLRQPKVLAQSKAVRAQAVDEAITPKSFLDMTDVEQEMHLRLLRERRLKAQKVIADATAAKQRVSSVSDTVKLERKIDATQKQYNRVVTALEKLEDMLRSLRVAQLQYTDNTDITRLSDE